MDIGARVLRTIYLKGPRALMIVFLHNSLGDGNVMKLK